MYRVKTRVCVRNEKSADEKRKKLFPETVHMRNCTSLCFVGGGVVRRAGRSSLGPARHACAVCSVRGCVHVGTTTGIGTRCQRLERHDCYSIYALHHPFRPPPPRSRVGLLLLFSQHTLPPVTAPPVTACRTAYHTQKLLGLEEKGSF